LPRLSQFQIGPADAERALVLDDLIDRYDVGTLHFLFKAEFGPRRIVRVILFLVDFEARSMPKARKVCARPKDHTKVSESERVDNPNPSALPRSTNPRPVLDGNGLRQTRHAQGLDSRSRGFASIR
jgi:hypothetical protein